MEESIVQVNFRMPADLKAMLEEAAAKGGRSLTAEVVARLQASFEASQEPNTIAEVAQRLESLHAQMEALNAKSVAVFIDQVRNGEIAFDKAGKVIPGPNFKLGEKMPVRGSRKKR